METKVAETAGQGNLSIQSLPAVGERRLFPGLSAVTMPKARGLEELHVAAQPFACLLYARQARDLRASLARGLDDRRLRARSVTVLPAGLETHWVYRAPVVDTSPRLQTLHLWLSEDFTQVLERDVAPDRVQAGMNVQIPGLSQRMERALRAFEAPEAFQTVALQSAAFAATALLIDPVTARQSAGASSFTKRRHRLLVAYVDDNLEGDVTLSGMADAVGLSPWHFTRVFKAAMGVTPYAWVITRRIARVKDALSRSNASLAEIARDCGFATHSHMTDVFRRIEGTTPGRWRTEIRGTPEAGDQRDD